MFTCGKSTEDMGSRIPDAYRDVMLARVQFNETRSGFEMRESGFLLNLQCSNFFLKGLEDPNVVAA